MTAACPAKPLPAPAVEQYVADRLAEATADGTLVEEARAALERHLEVKRERLVKRRAELPAEVAAVAASVARYVEELRRVEGRARKVVARRLEQESENLAMLEESLAEVERSLEALEVQRVEREWVAQSLEDFARVWDVLTPANQGRLLRALVERVVVDEQRQQVAVHLVDLTATLRWTPPHQRPSTRRPRHEFLHSRAEGAALRPPRSRASSTGGWCRTGPRWRSGWG